MTVSANDEQYAQIADLYDHVVPYRNRPDVTFFVDAAVKSGGPVLEIGCGTGRVLIPTARAGVEIVGLDRSHSMLAICRDHLRNEPDDVRARVQLVHTDMRHFTLERSFELITLPFRPFQHLITVSEQLACLASIHRHLRARGRLILDIFNPSLESLIRVESGTETGAEPEFTMPDGRRVVRKHRIAGQDRVNQINHVELIYYVTHPDGQVERLVQAFPMRYLFRYEAEHLLARAGFAVEQVFADYDKNPYGSSYPGELLFVARKQG